MSAPRSLAGCHILLVEDEFFQAREAKTLLEDAGAEVVGPAARAADAAELIRAGQRLDAAVIDINIEGSADFTVAALLQSHGIPFVFLTGYDDHVIPPGFTQAPRLEKPASEKSIIAAIAQVLS